MLMKRNPITIILIALLMALILALTIKTARAEEEIQVVEIVVIPTPTPPPPTPPPTEIKNFAHDEKDIEILAELLWSSPLRDEEAKKTLCWVVLNRVSDQSGTFGNSISEVVTKSEFSFYDYHAHKSETNLRIAREAMDEWMSDDHGFYVGRHVPANGLYIRFVGENNRGIEVTATRGGDALTW